MSALASASSVFNGRSFRVAAPKRAVARASGVAVRAKLDAGDKVKVVSKVVVYHVPKGDRKNGTDLSGWEGVVDSRADDYNGTYISANLEVKVAFPVPNDPKGKTFIVHCKENELEKQ
mmetsp:Transcript_5102/g.22801  ORF Transcript_5102/g.22801 Transcript_5102/m.22801 type:complete len:118 (-) Transcript_5102:272-625(-)